MTASEFKQRFIPHTAAMYRTAFRLTANAQEAEDMVQEAFIRLWNRREHIQPTNDLAAYCCAVTHNVCIDAQRRRQPDISHTPLETMPLPTDHDAAHAVETRETQQLLQEAIDSLPEGQRKVVQMRHIEDRSIPEIQALTGFTASNIRVLLSRARRHLKTLLSHDNKP